MLKTCRRGAGLAEYVTLTGVISAALVGAAAMVGDGVDEIYSESTWALKHQMIMQTGFVSLYKDKKVIGIAEDYQGKVTFIFEEAGYRNALGLYKFDEEGIITDVQIIFANSSAQGSGGDLVPGESAVDVSLKARDQIGFFVASNAYSRNSEKYLTAGHYTLLEEDGTPASLFSDGLLTLWQAHPETGKLHPIRTQYAYNLFYSHADPERDYAPNVDGYPHTVGHIDTETGIITLGFEDLYSGGDNDYDDIILEFDVGRSNAAVLDPNLQYDYDGYDSWVQKLKLWE